MVESAVNALIARRDFLESDVEHMEQFLVDQRTRLREAATSMIDIAERVPGGLGEVRPPLLSASDDTVDADDEVLDATMAYERPTDDDDESDGDVTGEVVSDDAEEVAAPPPVMRLGFDES